MVVSEKTKQIIETSKIKEVSIYGYKSTQVENDIENLIEGKSVEVGYRAGCGRIDNTHLVFREWLKIIKSLKKDGFKISETNLTHANKSPTMAQGFWNSIVYKIDRK
jgi:hypothetical protein